MWYGKLVSKITKFIERRDRPTTVPSNQIAERQVVLVYDQSDHADFSKRDLIGHISYYALDNICPDTAHGTLDRESSVKMALLENCLVETPLSNALID